MVVSSVVIKWSVPKAQPADALRSPGPGLDLERDAPELLLAKTGHILWKKGLGRANADRSGIHSVL
jgi:hypothetical protein